MITKTTQNETKNFLGSLITKASIAFALASTLTLSAVAGPISDGGGNAVGTELFDFYENKNVEIKSIKEIISENNTLSANLQKLGEQFPELLKSLIEDGVGDKKWIFDHKEINPSAECKNATLVLVEKQKPIACQNKFEIRISKNWTASTNEMNVAGLVMHEIYLGYIMNQAPTMDAKNRDYVVRMLNRATFQSDYTAIENLIGTELNKRLWTKKEVENLNLIKEHLKKYSSDYCAGKPVTADDSFNAAVLQRRESRISDEEKKGIWIFRFKSNVIRPKYTLYCAKYDSMNNTGLISLSSEKVRLSVEDLVQKTNFNLNEQSTTDMIRLNTAPILVNMTLVSQTEENQYKGLRYFFDRVKQINPELLVNTEFKY